ncbi:MAG: aldehyde dehydrogenase family protein [Thermomicrobiales bacterium]
MTLDRQRILFNIARIVRERLGGTGDAGDERLRQADRRVRADIASRRTNAAAASCSSTGRSRCRARSSTYLREPLGVCALIVPWNFPMLIAAWKLGPCLATGNTAVLKPASNTPLGAVRLGEIALEAGLPEEVLNVVPGPGAVARPVRSARTPTWKIRLHRRDGDGAARSCTLRRTR